MVGIVKRHPWDRFEESYIPEPNSGCFLWVEAINERGYGRFSFKHNWHLAHRWCWTFIHGEIPGDLFVCHKCDVRCCVNPDHLFLGTHQDNIDDMMSKGRHAVYDQSWNRARGINHGRAKLTDADVIVIRSRLALGEKAVRLSEEYGVCQQTISNIKHGKKWVHVR